MENWKNKLWLAFWASMFWLVVGLIYLGYAVHGVEGVWAQDWRSIILTVSVTSFVLGPVLTFGAGIIMYSQGRYDATVDQLKAMAQDDEDEQYAAAAKRRYHQARRELNSKWLERQKRQKPTHLPPTSGID